MTEVRPSALVLAHRIASKALWNSLDLDHTSDFLRKTDEETRAEAIRLVTEWKALHLALGFPDNELLHKPDWVVMGDVIIELRGVMASGKGFDPGRDRPCQVVSPQIKYNLTCLQRESGGLRCEVIEPHELGFDGCRISEHTIAHARMGNGYSCKSIDALLKAEEEESG